MSVAAIRAINLKPFISEIIPISFLVFVRVSVSLAPAAFVSKLIGIAKWIVISVKIPKPVWANGFI